MGVKSHSFLDVQREGLTRGLSERKVSPQNLRETPRGYSRHLEPSVRQMESNTGTPCKLLCPSRESPLVGWHKGEEGTQPQCSDKTRCLQGPGHPPVVYKVGVDELREGRVNQV